MKLAYFHLLTADNDDVDLGAAKVMGYVPTTCLLGGVMVWKAVATNRDPCATCNGPREKCQGREKMEIPSGQADIAAMLTGSTAVDPFNRFFPPGR